MTGEEYKKLMAAAAKAGESQEFYNDILNQLSELRGKLDWGHPWNKEVQMAISALHSKLAMPASSPSVITHTVNIGGSFKGTLQSGENNSATSNTTSASESNSVLKWILDNVIGVVISGVILALVLLWLGLNNP